MVGGGGGGGGGGVVPELAAFRAKVETSHGRAGGAYRHVHCGSTVPALACTASPAWLTMYRSDPRPLSPGTATALKPDGRKTPVNAPPTVSIAPIVTVNASAPALTAIGAAWATIFPPVSTPLAELCAPSASVKSFSTPDHAGIDAARGIVRAERQREVVRS